MKRSKVHLLASLLLLAGLFNACKKEAKPEEKLRIPELAVTPTTNAYNLNVIYFVPSDADTIVNFRNRINGIMRHGQRFYAKWMNYWGYGDRTFGVSNDAIGRIKITVVNGALPKASYPYSGGGNTVISELNTYFAANPSQKESEHTLVIMPASTYDANGEPGGVPFYGLGRWCFALDYADMDTSYLGATGTLGNRATKWIGGLMHELGHGLNLPHDHEKVSEYADVTKGTALMGSGNYTYGKSATFLTKAECALLNNSQTFRTSTTTGIYGGGSATILNLQANYVSGNINLGVKFSATQTVNNVIVYQDRDDGADYDAVAWVAVPSSDSIYLSMPVSELQNTTGTYKLRIRFLFTNGSHTEKSYAYSFVSNLPVLNISMKTLKSRSGWSITSVDSQENDGQAVNLLDNNPATIWHTQWKTTSPAHPHTVVVNMGSTQTINGLAFLQRENLNGSLKDITIYTSTDNITYTTGISHTLQNVNTYQYYTFSSPRSARYIKIVSTNNYLNTNHAILAELAAF